MSAVAVRAMFRSHPEKPPHSEIMSRCIDSCFNCVETCTACADACLSERDVSDLVGCIRLNLDCAAVCSATGSIMSRSNKAGHRQLLEAQLANCVAFCRACADACDAHGRRLQRDAGGDADAGVGLTKALCSSAGRSNNHRHHGS
jgi:hypothetical protein